MPASLAGWVAPAVLLAVGAAPDPGKVPETRAPRKTVWARVGGGAYGACRAYDRAAAQVFGAASLPASTVRWTERAAECGRAIHVLLVAARELAVAGVGVELARMSDEARRVHERARAENLDRAERLIARALGEARAIGDLPPVGAVHLRAYVALAAGRVDAARRLGTASLARGDVPTWRALRLLAAVDLLEGELASAVTRIDAAIRSGEVDTRASGGITQALAAWIFDRVGDHRAARDAFDQSGVGRNPSSVLAAAAMLPFHERVYLLALYQAHVGNTEHARILFEAYLGRSEPSDAERELARRHLAALERARRPGP
ncbi:MAG: hypothetical protein D6705_01460 [Deltaproteobacteria bacterium]|nr:MAG: hypothetical protein D6705_01460 [Deltaproteobacteria bacterium]